MLTKVNEAQSVYFGEQYTWLANVMMLKFFSGHGPLIGCFKGLLLVFLT